MRYSAEARIVLAGDKVRAEAFVPAARTVLGEAMRKHSLLGSARVIREQKTIQGATITVSVAGSLPEIHIYVPEKKIDAREKAGKEDTLYILVERVLPDLEWILDASLPHTEQYLVKTTTALSSFELIGGPWPQYRVFDLDGPQEFSKVVGVYDGEPIMEHTAPLGTPESRVYRRQYTWGVSQTSAYYPSYTTFRVPFIIDQEIIGECDSSTTPGGCVSLPVLTGTMPGWTLILNPLPEAVEDEHGEIIRYVLDTTVGNTWFDQQTTRVFARPYPMITADGVMVMLGRTLTKQTERLATDTIFELSWGMVEGTEETRTILGPRTVDMYERRQKVYGEGWMWTDAGVVRGLAAAIRGGYYRLADLGHENYKLPSVSVFSEPDAVLAVKEETQARVFSNNPAQAVIYNLSANYKFAALVAGNVGAGDSSSLLVFDYSASPFSPIVEWAEEPTQLLGVTLTQNYLVTYYVYGARAIDLRAIVPGRVSMDDAAPSGVRGGVVRNIMADMMGQIGLSHLSRPYIAKIFHEPKEAYRIPGRDGGE